MNDRDAKSAAIKTLAIIGFIGAVVLALWLVVQVVKFIPTAFTNLASIVDSMNGRDSFSMELEKNIVNSGEPLRIFWEKEGKDGHYEFSFKCAEGISAEVRNTDDEIENIDCNDRHTVEEGRIVEERETFDVIFRSEKQRFSDVTLTFSFVPDDGDTEESYEKNAVVTIVNATIPQGGTRTTPPVVRTTEEPKPTPSVKPTPTPKPKPVYYRTVPITKTTYPASNPNGFTDLEVSYIAVGQVKSGNFVRYTSLEEGERGAIQIAVKNIGTKTSSIWHLEGTLPTDDEDFRSSAQAPLLPGERALLTISFDDVSDEGSETIKIEVDTANDSRSSNDSFRKSVRIN